MKQKTKILIFCMVFVANGAFCQKNNIFPLGKTNQNKSLSTVTYGFNSRLAAIQTIPANFYAQQLGFFCKKEIRFESTTKIPLKFRLGSVSYCDWMEGKKPFILP